MYEEKYKLRESELISLIQGKKLIFNIPNVLHIEIIPPNCGLTITYQHWELIKSYLMQVDLPFNNMETLIKLVEDRK